MADPDKPIPADSPLAEAISCERRMGLSWAPLAAPPEAADYEHWQDDNLRVLSAVALLDESRQSAPSTEDPNSVESEVARLHQKVNLVIDLLALLAAQQQPGMAERKVRLSWKGLVWSDEQLRTGLGLVSLRLHRSVPQALVWPARVRSTDRNEVVALFEPMREPLQTALERHVFLHHRRAIAGGRRGA